MLARVFSVAAVALLVSCAPDVIEQGGDDSRPPVVTSCETTNRLVPFTSGRDVIDAQCLAATPAQLPNGGASCAVIDAWTSLNGECACDGALGREEIEPRFEPVATSARESARAKHFGWDCFCELRQLVGDAGGGCRNDPTAQSVSGFCYVDPTTTPPIGNASLAAACPSTKRHLLRFTGASTEHAAANIEPDSEQFVIVCDVACK